MQPGALPDPGLVFDSLFARQKFNPSPNKVSSIFFNWASLIIHGKPTWTSKTQSLILGRPVSNRSSGFQHLSNIVVLGSVHSLWRRARRPRSHEDLQRWQDQARLLLGIAPVGLPCSLWSNAYHAESVRVMLILSRATPNMKQISQLCR